MQTTWILSLGWEDPPEKEMVNGYPLQYSCLENSTDRGARWATVHELNPKSWVHKELNPTEQLKLSLSYIHMCKNTQPCIKDRYVNIHKFIIISLISSIHASVKDI